MPIEMLEYLNGGRPAVGDVVFHVFHCRYATVTHVTRRGLCSVELHVAGTKHKWRADSCNFIEARLPDRSTSV